MKNSYLILATVCSLFITTSTAPYLGISLGGTFAYGLFFLLFSYNILISDKRLYSKKFRIEYAIILIFFVYSFFQYFVSGWNVIQSAFFFVLVPMLISITVRLQSIKTKSNIVKVILVFFFIECALAIIEKILQKNVFPMLVDGLNPFLNVEDWQFRSTALLGHPLNNALCTSTILGFIIVGKFSTWFKAVSIALGFMAILAFNARGATIIMGLVILYYLYMIVKKGYKSPDKRFIFLLLFGLLIIGAFNIISDTSFGGRIYNDKTLIDGSALTRLRVLGAFDYLNGRDLWIGNPSLYLPITHKLGAAGIENSFVVIILNFGLLFGIPLIIGLILFVLKRLGTYSLKQKILLISSFLLVGSTNNGLSTLYPWVVFLLCANCFSYINIKSFSTQPIKKKGCLIKSTKHTYSVA